MVATNAHVLLLYAYLPQTLPGMLRSSLYTQLAWVLLLYLTTWVMRRPDFGIKLTVTHAFLVLRRDKRSVK